MLPYVTDFQYRRLKYILINQNCIFMSTLKINNLSKTYPNGVKALDNVSLELENAAAHWMNVARERISAITSNTEVPTFRNTLVPLEFASKELGVVSSCFFNLNSAETNEDIQSIARELSPKLTLFNNETLLNEALFLRIKTVWENREEEQLDAESARLLKETYEGFVRNGALLEGQQRESLKSISEKLSTANAVATTAKTTEFHSAVVAGAGSCRARSPSAS